MKKIIAEDKFGWPIEVTLTEAKLANRYIDGTGTHQDLLEKLKPLLSGVSKTGVKLAELRKAFDAYSGVHQGVPNLAHELFGALGVPTDPNDRCRVCMGSGSEECLCQGEGCSECGGTGKLDCEGCSLPNETPHSIRDWAKKVQSGEGDAQHIEDKLSGLILNAAQEQGLTEEP